MHPTHQPILNRLLNKLANKEAAAMAKERAKQREKQIERLRQLNDQAAKIYQQNCEPVAKLKKEMEELAQKLKQKTAEYWHQKKHWSGATYKLDRERDQILLDLQNDDDIPLISDFLTWIAKETEASQNAKNVLSDEKNYNRLGVAFNPPLYDYHKLCQRIAALLTLKREAASLKTIRSDELLREIDKQKRNIPNLENCKAKPSILQEIKTALVGA